MIHYLAVTVLVAYLIASVSYLWAIIGKTKSASKYGRLFLISSFILQTILIFPFVASEPTVIPESRGEYFFWLSWALPLLCILGKKRFDYPIVGAFIAPAAALFFSASSYLIHHLTGNPEIRADSTIIIVHVLPAFIAELCLVVAFIVSCIFLIQDNRIKKKSVAAFDSPGPSLETLESFNQKVLTIGFVSMTLAILSGTIWALAAHRIFFAGDYYQWVSLAVWLVLAFMLHVRTNLNWSAKRLSRATIIVTSVLMLSIVINIMLEGNSIHRIYG